MKQILLLAILSLLLLEGCKGQQKQVKTIDEKMFSTKLEQGKLVKDSLQCCFLNAYHEDGTQYYSVMTYPLLTDTTWHEKRVKEVEEDKTLYYDSNGTLLYVERKNGDSIISYRADNLTQPLVIRITDKAGRYTIKRPIIREHGCDLLMFTALEVDANGQAVNGRNDKLSFDCKEDLYRYEQTGDEALVQLRKTTLHEYMYTYYD